MKHAACSGLDWRERGGGDSDTCDKSCNSSRAQRQRTVITRQPPAHYLFRQPCFLQPRPCGYILVPTPRVCYPYAPSLYRVSVRGATGQTSWNKRHLHTASPLSTAAAAAEHSSLLTLSATRSVWLASSRRFREACRRAVLAAPTDSSSALLTTAHLLHSSRFRGDKGKREGWKRARGRGGRGRGQGGGSGIQNATPM